MEKVKKISIKSVDTDLVEKDDSFPEALAFYVYLSEVPESVWREFFSSEYEQSWFNLKREVTVSGDRIRIVTSPGEEQQHIDFIKQVVERTNRQVDEYNGELERQQQLDAKNRAKESKLVEDAKERLKRVRL